MPSVDLEEEVTTKKGTDAASEPLETTTTTEESAEPVASEGEGQDDALTRGLEGLDPTMAGAEVPAGAVGEDTPPEGVKVDEKGRWRDADGKFFAKQPNAEAAKSARDERAQMLRVAEYKAKGLDEKGNKPWTPNIYGTEKAVVAGALDRPGIGIFIPESARPTINALVARGEQYHDLKAAKQTYEQTIQREQERTSFYAETFTAILTDTLLNPEWMERATKDQFTYETAKESVKNRLNAATVDAKERFGAIPAKTERATTASRPDDYEAEEAVDTYLDELAGAEPAMFAGLDKAAVKAELIRVRPPLFAPDAEGGHLLDIRPIRIIAENVVLRQKASQPAAQPADPAKARNVAAVPAKAPAAKVSQARPAAQPTDPRNDPRYVGREQDNPALPLDERRTAYYRNLGIRQPG